MALGCRLQGLGCEALLCLQLGKRRVSAAGLHAATQDEAVAAQVSGSILIRVACHCSLRDQTDGSTTSERLAVGNAQDQITKSIAVLSACGRNLLDLLVIERGHGTTRRVSQQSFGKRLGKSVFS